MGRKSNAAKFADKAGLLDNTNASVKGLQLKHQSNDNISESLETKPESSNVTLEKVESEPKSQAKSTKVSSRELAKTTGSVRRSQRLLTVVPQESQDVNCVIRAITLSDTDEEVEPTDEELPQASLSKENLESKVHYLEQLLESQQKALDALLSKAKLRPLYGKSSGIVDISYKGLYIESQKKVEDLLEKNNQLTNKLENALGKLEVYEKQNTVCFEMLEKWKDMLMLSSLTKAHEVAVNASSEAIQGALTALDPGLQHKNSAKRTRLSSDTGKH
ncbi:hypothetical protein K2173_003055 [Erythroxylum novogranatense]|uniref:Uncharacterized protein n=1 Tax=Erythroxylum novogranatense TaxID=1862640 RepID=A0AAV8S8Q3_9ROSI|nr:hypothetical protein K2173_003055 [Erythroxylum novogranatense]